MKDDKKRLAGSSGGKVQPRGKPSPSQSSTLKKKDNYDNGHGKSFKKVSLDDMLPSSAKKVVSTFDKKRPYSAGDRSSSGSDAKKQKTSSFNNNNSSNKWKGTGGNGSGKGKKEEPKTFKDLKKERQSNKPNFELVEKVPSPTYLPTNLPTYLPTYP